MRKVLLTLGLAAFVASQSQAQLVNSTNIFIAEGAILSIGTDVTNNGVIENKGNLELKNNIKNNNSFVSSGLLTLSGENPIQIDGSKKLSADHLVLEGDVQLDRSLAINKSLDFRNGVIFTTDNSAVEFGSEAGHTSVNDFSHVAGNVQKTGRGSFVFPTGDGLQAKTFEVSDLGGRTYEANYVSGSPLDISSELESDVDRINTREYWTLKSDNSSRVGVRLREGSVVSVEKGLWSKSSKGILTSSNDKAVFTSGDTKDIVKEIGVWPNPTSGEFNLKLIGMKDADDITVDITNQDGTVIQKLKGKVSELRKAYQLPKGLVTTNLVVRVINGEEVLTQNLILNK